MSETDWLAVFFILPCLLFKSTRVAALVLLLVFPFYYLIKSVTDAGMARYMLFGAQDAIIAIIFYRLASIKKQYKMEDVIALLSACAVIYHFLAFVAYEKDMSRVFYGNACMIIVILQISLLYVRVAFNGRSYKNACRCAIFRVINTFNYSYGCELNKKTYAIKKGKKA